MPKCGMLQEPPLMLTITNWQVDSPGAVTVARVVARETRTENHALHLLPDSTTLS